MKIPHFMVGSAIAVALALQSWTLNEVVSLKVELARLRAVVETHIEKGERSAITKTTNEKALVNLR